MDPEVPVTNTILDLAGPIEVAVDAADADYNCNAYVCRGFQYEDNVDLLQTYQAGDVVDFHIDLIAGHRPGYAVRFSQLPYRLCHER